MREAFTFEYEHPDGRKETVRVVRAEVFRRWRRRATAAFVGLMVVSSAGIYLAENSRSSSDRNLRAEAHRAVTRSCQDRADVRITVAVGFDELRRLAITEPRTAEERAQIAAFLERTQVPIDRLLSEAAGATVKTKGELRPDQIENVRDLATRRCRALGERFERDASAGD